LNEGVKNIAESDGKFLNDAKKPNPETKPAYQMN